MSRHRAAETTPAPPRGAVATAVAQALTWFDTSSIEAPADGPKRVHWARLAPFLLLHVGCLAVIWVGWSPVAVGVALALYVLRALFVTAFYHRYFAHRSYETSRAAQFVFAVLGNSAAQRGPLWWAAHHRLHHGTTDHEGDPHSPHVDGFLWSHIGWLTDPRNFPTNLTRVADLARYPELRWLDRFDTVVPTLLAAATYGLGSFLNWRFPTLGTSGPQMLVWGFFVSTVIVFHVTCLVNSAAHLFGKRPFATDDQSRNNWLIALLAMGEGWHNNHHRYPASARQGFTAREIDVTYWALKLLSWTGLIRNLRPVPIQVMQERGRPAGRLALVVVALAFGSAGTLSAATSASDPQAVAVAQATLAAMGGQRAWDDTRIVAWNFFGHRKHLWDKSTGDVRIEAKTRDGSQVLVLMNLGTRQGHAWKNGQEVVAQEELAKLIEAGYAWWVNDSYWLLMPYKLLDPGVILKSKGQAAMQDGRMADCLELTFDNVGLTPQNRYLVYVAKDSSLVEQWDFFEKAADEKPGFQIPWHGWEKHGRIMLSGDRGENKLTDIAVFDALPRETFTSPVAPPAP